MQTWRNINWYMFGRKHFTKSGYEANAAHFVQGGTSRGPMCC